MGQDVELILLKQLASCLRIPIALLAPDGAVVYFNEPAESIFGLRFEEIGGLDADQWPALLQPSDDTHVPLKREQRPLMVALDRHAPGHRSIHVRTGSRGWREVEVTGIPLVASSGRFLGALSLFWPCPTGSEPSVTPAPPDAPLAVETILTRRLASRLATPIFLVDPVGRLLYYNGAAGDALGHPFSESTEPGNRLELYEAFSPRDGAGNPLAPEEHPMAIARQRGEPIHRLTWIRGLDGSDRRIEITAVPLVGQSDRLVGAFGLFWESRGE